MFNNFLSLPKWKKAAVIGLVIWLLVFAWSHIPAEPGAFSIKVYNALALHGYITLGLYALSMFIMFILLKYHPFGLFQKKTKFSGTSFGVPVGQEGDDEVGDGGDPWEDEEDPESGITEQPPSPPSFSKNQPPRRRVPLLVLGGLVLLAVGVLIFGAYLLNGSSAVQTPVATVVPQPTASMNVQMVDDGDDGGVGEQRSPFLVVLALFLSILVILVILAVVTFDKGIWSLSLEPGEYVLLKNEITGNITPMRQGLNLFFPILFKVIKGGEYLINIVVPPIHVYIPLEKPAGNGVFYAEAKIDLELNVSPVDHTLYRRTLGRRSPPDRDRIVSQSVKTVCQKYSPSTPFNIGKLGKFLDGLQESVNNRLAGYGLSGEVNIERPEIKGEDWEAWQASMQRSLEGDGAKAEMDAMGMSSDQYILYVASRQGLIGTALTKKMIELLEAKKGD